MTRDAGSDAGDQAAASPRRRDTVRLGAALRRAWIGYQRLLDEEMAAAGFGERHLPDGRVLRICARRPDVTISEIGRELGVTRQGASKIVGVLKGRKFVTLRPSAADAREKQVMLTTHAMNYLDAQRKAARAIERRLRGELGEEAFEALYTLLAVLGTDDQERLRDYLRGRLT